MAVFWVVAPCSLVEVYQRFRGPCCLHHQGVLPDYTALHPRRQSSSFLHDVSILAAHSILCFLFSYFVRVCWSSDVINLRCSIFVVLSSVFLIHFSLQKTNSVFSLGKISILFIFYLFIFLNVWNLNMSSMELAPSRPSRVYVNRLLASEP
jgi:hypothetical protein